MDEKLNKFIDYLGEFIDLLSTQALLQWDQQVNMPEGGAKGRGHTLSTIGILCHKKATSAELGRMIEELEPIVKTLEPDSDEARMIQYTRREYNKLTKVTPEWVGEYAMAASDGQATWEKAKSENNFKLFQPKLERIVELRKQYVEFFKPYDHVYDPLLNFFEPGLKTAEVKEIFNILRPKQVELIKAIGQCKQVDDSFLHVDYPEKAQWEFGEEVITRFGYDWKCGRQDKAVHPFTQTIYQNDVRITTRFDPERGASALFSTMHEGGHALYELGFPQRFFRTVLANAASYAIHESQSRMWENLVGRSLAFWKFFYPKFQKAFPSALANVDLMTFYKGINKVEPTLIRVEADEATYNLHVMLRLEIEIALMEGSLQVKDLPDAWNTKMKEYLGLTPPNDAKGVLQDVHWSEGYFGYFPTYALGNLVSVQFWNKMHQYIPTLETQIEKGEFSELLSWLRKNVHEHGAKFPPQELIQKVTGSKIDPKPYLQYLETKYKDIYGF